MAVTTVISTIFHAVIFLAYGVGMLLLYATAEQAGTPTVQDYAVIVMMFVFFMLHAFALICLLERSPRARTHGYSVVTIVLEVIACPVYALVGYMTIGKQFYNVLFIFAAMLLFSLIGNIYCVIRHTIAK
jgi:hypothetical protein